MFTTTWILWGLVLPAVLAAALMIIARFLGARRARVPRGSAILWPLVTAAGFFACYWATVGLPQLPPTVARARILVILCPVAIVIAWLASARWWRLATALRAAAAMTLPWCLLMGSTYLTGYGSRGPEWLPMQALLYLNLAGAGAFIIWQLTWSAEGRRADHWLVVALLVLTAGFGLTMSASGGLATGELALGLAATLAAAWLVASAAPAMLTPIPNAGVTSLAVPVLIALWINGLFFDHLEPWPAALLAIAPLALWVSECPGITRLRPWQRGAARLLAVAILVALACVPAVLKAIAEQNHPSDPYSY